MQDLRVFISSPGDVGAERVRARHVLDRLQAKYARRIRLEGFFWEHEPQRATKDFQKNIPRPANFDIVVCILWSRLGTMLSADYTRPDGSRYESGTAYEMEDAKEAFEKSGRPDLLVYRSHQELRLPREPEEARHQKLAQYEALESFLQRWFINKDGTFRAALTTYEDVPQFEDLLEKHLDTLIAARAPTEDVSPAERVRVASWYREPFVGLRTFDFEDAGIFFGRLEAIEKIRQAMLDQAEEGRSFTLVYGGSGTGKSSLVRAGVIPLITQPGVVENVGLWRRATMRPSDGRGDLCAALAESLTTPTAVPELIEQGVAVGELARFLRESPDAALLPLRMSLLAAARKVRDAERLDREPLTRLVVLVDQLEEVFTDSERITAEERTAFIKALGVLARSGLVWVVTTMRSDFFARCEELPELLALTEGRGQLRLLPPNETEIDQMIRLPAIAAGLEYEEDRVSGARLENRLRDAAMKDRQSLPLLEFTLRELYLRRKDDRLLTHAAYDELGGLEGAIASEAQRVVDQLKEKGDTPSLRPLVRALASVGGDGEQPFARRVARYDEVTGDPSTRRLVDAFVEGRLLVVDEGREGEGRTVQVAHEALFYHWPPLREELEANRSFLELRSRAATAAALWRRKDRRSGYLWMSGDLARDARALQAESADLQAPEREFVSSSLACVVRRRRVQWLAAAALLIVLGLAAWFSMQRPPPVVAAIDEKPRQLEDLREQLSTVRVEAERPAATPSPRDNSDGKPKKQAGDLALDVQEISRRILLLKPNDSTAWKALAESQYRLANFDGMAKTLDDWRASSANPPAEIKDLLARREWKLGNKEKAIEGWREYRKSLPDGSPDQVQVIRQLAQAFSELRRWQDAADSLSDWIRLADNLPARVLRAKAQVRLGRWSDAVADIEKASEMDATAPELLESLPQFERIKAIAKQYDQIQEGLQATPDNLDLWFARAVTAASVGQFDMTCDDFQQLQKMDEGAMAPYLGRAFFLWMQKLPVPAKPTVRPSQWWPVQPGQSDQAVWRFLENLANVWQADVALRGKMDNDELLTKREIALYRADQPLLGLLDSERILARNPESYAGLIGKVACLWSSDRSSAEALVTAERAVKLHPKENEAWDFYGRLLYGKNRFEEAAAAFTNAINLAPNNSWLYEWRGAIYQRMGKNAEAAADRAKEAELKKQQQAQKPKP